VLLLDKLKPTLVLIHSRCCLTLQMESEALSQREAALASSHASQQAELDALLAKQEERLKGWQEGCQELEVQLEARRKELGQEESRCAGSRIAGRGWKEVGCSMACCGICSRGWHLWLRVHCSQLLQQMG
jgi:hypothetical protein